MDKYSGKEATIIYVVPGSSAMGGQIYILDIDNNGYGWSSIWLTKLGLKLPDKSMQRRPRSGFGVMLSAFRAAR